MGRRFEREVSVEQDRERTRNLLSLQHMNPASFLPSRKLEKKHCRMRMPTGIMARPVELAR
eukprot:1738182-Prorocentrum_lima.AAC.1